MTPEEVEARLEGLVTPAPPERLRERCLSGSRPRRGSLWSFAAALLFVPILFWVITSPSKPKPADRPAQGDSEAVLKMKCEDLLRKNPGKSVLVVRLRELRGGVVEPVKEGLEMTMHLEVDIKKTPPPKGYKSYSADVDRDGLLLFVVPPGDYRGVGYNNGVDDRLKELSFTWEYEREFTAPPGRVVVLADAIFAPLMEWAWPVQGSTVSLSGKQKLAWKPYPQVSLVAVRVARMIKNSDGTTDPLDLGTLTFGESAELAAPLSALRQSTPFDLGDRLRLQLEGYSGSGKKLTKSRTIEITAKE